MCSTSLSYHHSFSLVHFASELPELVARSENLLPAPTEKQSQQFHSQTGVSSQLLCEDGK